MLLHPSLAGQDASALTNLLTGHPLVEDLRAAADSPSKRIEYRWNNPVLGRPDDMMAYVGYSKVFDWHFAYTFSRHYMESKISSQVNRLAGLLLLALTGGLVLLWLGMNRIISPLKMLAESARSLPSRDFIPDGPFLDRLRRVSSGNKNEIGELARSYLFMIDELQKRLTELERSKQRIDAFNRDLEFQVRERTKELNCLYGLSSIIEKGGSLDEVFQGAVELLPPAMQCPEISCARIIFEDREFAMRGFRSTPWRLAAPIVVHGRPVGALEVHYLEQRPECDLGPFLKEELSLIGEVAECLGRHAVRMRAEQALLQSQQQLAEIFENAPVGIYQATAEGSFLRANDELSMILGYGSSEDLMQSVTDIRTQVYVDPEKREEMWSILSQKGWVDDFEALNKRKDGSHVWTSRTCRAVRDASGRVLFADSFLVDISERKSLETIREDVERIIRHDLRSPLSGIISLPQALLIDDNLTQEQRKLIHLISSSGYRMLNMINLSQVMYQMETGQYQLNAKEANLLALLGRVLAEMKSFLEYKRLSVQILLEGRPAGKDDCLIALCEELLCLSLFENLLKNACEASPHGESILVSLSTQAPFHVVDVTNQGEVPEKIRGRFFDKYVTSGKKQGTGLGTYSARLMSKAQGGSIELDASRQGQTTVIVRLPIHPAQVSPTDQREVKTEARGLSLSVLLVEDHKMMQIYLKQLLEKVGHRVMIAPNGATALSLLSEDLFDLVLMDMEMSEINGVEAARLIRGDSSGRFDPNLPIIAISAHAADEYRERCLEAGMDYYLTKPFKDEELRAAITRVMRGDGKGCSEYGDGKQQIERRGFFRRDLSSSPPTARQCTIFSSRTNDQSPCFVQNISSSGAMLSAASLPPVEEGEELFIEIGSAGGLLALNRAKADLVWQDGERCGISFHNPIESDQVYSWLNQGVARNRRA